MAPKKKITEKDNEALLKDLQNSREALQKIQRTMPGQGEKNVMHARTLRRDIARLLTELHARGRHAQDTNA